jgi:hypothetical protein
MYRYAIALNIAYMAIVIGGVLVAVSPRGTFISAFTLVSLASLCIAAIIWREIRWLRYLALGMSSVFSIFVFFGVAVLLWQREDLILARPVFFLATLIMAIVPTVSAISLAMYKSQSVASDAKA